MKYLFLTLISFSLFAALFNTTKYHVEYDGYLITDLEDVAHAIKRQINHSQGPLLNLKQPGNRATLSHFYDFSVRDIETLSNGHRKIHYTFSGELLAERNVNLDNFKVVVPLQAKEAHKKAMRFRKGRCGASSNIAHFFHYWSPYYKNCRLKKGIDYEEFKLKSFIKKNNDITHLSSEFLINNEYNLYYYFGSDHFSLRRFGFAEQAYNTTKKLFKKKGFRKITDSNEKEEMFKSLRLYSRFQKMSGTLNGKIANVYILLGNPTDSTPGAKYEFFRFMKHAFKHGSSIQYSGHAGLGSVFNLDSLEEQYNEIIEYNQNQKQIIYLDGCNTYFYSKNFFFTKKKINNSLVFISNGETILTNHYKQAAYVLADMLSRPHFTNKDVENSVYYYMRHASTKEHQMLDVSSN